MLPPTIGQMINIPAGHRLLGRFLRMKESPVSSLNYSNQKFLQDTLINWTPKMLVNRTLAERAESTFLELPESFINYYLGPLSGKRFNTLASKIAGKTVRHQSPVRAGTILATLGLVIGGEYLLTYAKNLFTSKVFKKENFSDVIGLSNSKQNQGEVTKKAKRRINQTLIATGAFMAAALALPRLGQSSKLLRSLSDKVIKYLDFGKNFNLSPNQFLSILGVGVIPSYLDAARDKMERLEILTRLPISLSYIMFGQELLQGRLQKHYLQKFPEVFSQGAKGLEERSIDELARLFPEKFPELLKVKNKLFFIPLLIGVSITGIGVGLLNRYWTARRFENKQKQLSAHPIASRQSIPMGTLQRKSFSEFGLIQNRFTQAAIGIQNPGRQPVSATV